MNGARDRGQVKVCQWQLWSKALLSPEVRKARADMTRCLAMPHPLGPTCTATSPVAAPSGSLPKELITALAVLRGPHKVHRQEETPWASVGTGLSLYRRGCWHRDRRTQLTEC